MDRERVRSACLGFEKCESMMDRQSPKELKFGIDRILATDPDRERNTSEQQLPTSCSCYVHQCCPFTTAVETSLNNLCSPLCISNSQFLAATKFGNFIIQSDHQTVDNAVSKRKRIWSRAVFSKLQRKGLEKRFQIQKYIMKPDRKQLASTLGLTDAQVKVWFQNRRMKWRNSKNENKEKNTEKDKSTAPSNQSN